MQPRATRSFVVSFLLFLGATLPAHSAPTGNATIPASPHPTNSIVLHHEKWQFGPEPQSQILSYSVQVEPASNWVWPSPGE